MKTPDLLETLRAELQDCREANAIMRKAATKHVGDECGCTADTELGAASGCAVCGHRDHGASGCRAALAAPRAEAAPLDVERLNTAFAHHQHDKALLLVIRNDHLATLTFRSCPAAVAAEYTRLAEAPTPEAEPVLDVLDGALAEYRECLEVRRLLGYLWTATGNNVPDMPVRHLFTADDPIVADVERLAIFPEAKRPWHCASCRWTNADNRDACGNCAEPRVWTVVE